MPTWKIGFYWITDKVRRLVGILHAGFDAAQDETTFMVVGVVFTREGAEGFEAAWKDLFAPYGNCHWVDLVHERKQFKGMEPGAKDALVEDAIGVAHAHYAHAITTACRRDDARAFFEFAEPLDGLRSEYGLCCTFAIRYLAGWLNETGRADSINYVFEDGDRGKGEVDAFLRAVGADDRLAGAYRYTSHAFCRKGQNVLMEVADCLAWENRKYNHDRFDPIQSGKEPIRPMRKSLAHLHDLDRCEFRFMTKLVMANHREALRPRPWRQRGGEA